MKIRVLELFSGIGAQHSAITNLETKLGEKIFEIVNISDWYAYANIAYAQLHYNFFDKIEEILERNGLLDLNSINEFLKQKPLSLNSKKPAQILRKPALFRRALAAAILISKNLGEISQIKSEELKETDLLVYTFPCQGLSVANTISQKGILNRDSTSSLIWEVYNVLFKLKTLPKYLLMENVPNLLSKKFLPEFEKWKKILDSFGYKTFTVVLSGVNFGSIQNRKRVFAFSFKKGIRLPFKTESELKQYLLNLGDDLENNSKKRQEIFNKIFSSNSQKENIESLINNKPSYQKMLSVCKKIDETESFIIRTITTKQARIPNAGIIKFENYIPEKLDYRFISPREAFLLMGFQNSDFDRLLPLVSEKTLTRDSLYKMAGNSIVVSVLEAVFALFIEIERKNFLWKAQTRKKSCSGFLKKL